MISETSPIVAESPAPQTPARAAASAVAVATEPRQHAAEALSYKRLLVAVDDSDQAGFAIDAAARMAKQLGAELLLVHVFRADVGFTPEFAFAEPDVRTAAVEFGNQMLAEAKQRASAVYAPAATFLREGDAAEEILDTALRLNADLIVIGTHGRGRIGHAMLGSVANSVVRRAVCPVMMVHSQPM